MERRDGKNKINQKRKSKEGKMTGILFYFFLILNFNFILFLVVWGNKIVEQKKKVSN